jgi:lipopolysaccharide/colanic/teichoic acid biosynthesis glycosyltransferase
MPFMTAEPMALASTIEVDAAPARPSPTPWSVRPAAVLGEAAGMLGPAAYAFSKRAIDICAAVVLLVLLAPLFAVVALAILREAGGPVFYCAERVGQHGRRFCGVKFRSMKTGCDQAVHQAFIKDLMQGQTCTTYKVPNDARVTRIGALLRKTSIDELPQLWNVLRGEMSLVGPRPDVPYAVTEYADWMHRRFDVKPGITGLWQVSGRSRLSLIDMYRLDVAFAERASLLLDLRILVRTIPVVLGRDGAQ